jgi:hypothetical protein
MRGVMRNGERSSEWPWLVAGTMLLMASSALVLFAYQDTDGHFPIPMYQAVLYFFMPYSLLFVVPLAFWGSFGFLWQSKRFGVLVLGIATIIGLLDGMWFAANWDDAYRYQGSALTLGVALANAVGFGVVATLSAIGLHKRSRAVIAAAYFMLFEVLVLFAFPFFGSHES